MLSEDIDMTLQWLRLHVTDTLAEWHQSSTVGALLKTWGVHQIVAELAAAYYTLPERYIPRVDHVPLLHQAFSAIVAHVVFYNLTAQLEYHTRIFTKIFGRLAVYLYGIALIASAGIRNVFLHRAIDADEGRFALLSDELSHWVGWGLVAYGVLLNLWTYKALGFKGVNNGDSFGYLMKAPVTTGPYRLSSDPQYLGTALLWFGIALLQKSAVGYVIAGFMYTVFRVSVLFIEGPHLRRIYAKRLPATASGKTKKRQ